MQFDFKHMEKHLDFKVDAIETTDNVLFFSSSKINDVCVAVHKTLCEFKSTLLISKAYHLGFVPW